MGCPAPSDGFRQIIEEVRDRTDIAQLVGELVSLEPSGSVLKGRSPWNTDRTPSFVVWPGTRTWRDFSGGGSVGGDCFDFVQKRDGVCFMDALRRLAAKAGVEVPGAVDADVLAELDRISGRRRVEGLLTAAAAYYHGVLPSKIRETWYRERYGFTDDTVDELLLGWADGHLYQHLTELLGASEKEALETGLFVRLGGGRIEDFFRDRLVFPYWRNGRVVYFIARATEHTGDEAWEQAKYKKLLTRSDRHPYVSRTITNSTFYNEDAARGAQELLITEGVTDCISAMQAGVPCVSPVTVRFRKKDHEKLATLTTSTKRVIICNDSEESGAGEAGALETARALHAAGRDVRIATIPRPEGKDKVDLNELVAAGGREALEEVTRAAQCLPEFLIESIPVDTAAADLSEQLKEVIPLLTTAGPLEREAYCDQIARRFKVRVAAVRELVRETQPEKASPAQKPTARKPEDTVKGEVFEETDHYYIIGPFGKRVTISSFQIEPTRRISLDGGEIFDADVTTNAGKVIKDVRFPREAWNSRSNFLKALRSADLQWTGSDDNVQGVLRLVASRKVPSHTGTMTLGLLETENGPRWISPSGLLGPEGTDVSREGLVYVPSVSSLSGRVRYVRPDRKQEREVARTLLPNILHLNTPEVILPILGWFFAAPLRPRINKVLGHFPPLFVWGAPGTGKTSLVTEVFWRLAGVASTEPYSATETEFALMTLLSATNSIPVFLDEYKPFDMARKRRHALHRLLRRVYVGEVEERGEKNQTVKTYSLHAPLCVAGETRPTEPALVHRILTSCPRKDAIARGSQFNRAFQAARSVDPVSLAPSVIASLLGRDTKADIARAKESLNGYLGARQLDNRIRDNLAVMVLGLAHFQDYASSVEVEIPDLDAATGRAVHAVLDDLLECGTVAKSALDTFLEELYVMAVDRKLEHENHYVYRDGLLAIHYPSCHALYSKHCREIDYDGEIYDRKSLRRQIVEDCQNRNLVVSVDERICFRNPMDRRRAVLIDIEKAKKRLIVEDFPVPRKSRGWPVDD